MVRWCVALLCLGMRLRSNGGHLPSGDVMKLALLTLVFAAAACAQSGRTATLTWTDDKNPGLTGQTYNIYRAIGACPVQPVQPAPPAPQLPPNLPAFGPAIATGVTVRTYDDVNVPVGVYCYAVEIAANGTALKSAPAAGMVTANAVTITVVVVH